MNNRVNRLILWKRLASQIMKLTLFVSFLALVGSLRRKRSVRLSEHGKHIIRYTQMTLWGLLVSSLIIPAEVELNMKVSSSADTSNYFLSLCSPPALTFHHHRRHLPCHSCKGSVGTWVWVYWLSQASTPFTLQLAGTYLPPPPSPFMSLESLACLSPTWTE